MASADLDRDAREFQRWQLAALEARPGGAQLLSVGPFRALIPPSDQAGGWVTIVDGPAAEKETKESVRVLRSLFGERHAELEIEYSDAFFPQVGAWLEASGLTLDRRDPLMACRPERYSPIVAPEVRLRRLSPDSDPADLGAFQTIRWTNGGDREHSVPSIDLLRKELRSTSSVYLLAWLGGEAAGTGVSHALKGTGELVGIVTRADKRRRGVAATVTSHLVARHFSTGGDFVFLDAANEPAAALYERIGFKRFGMNCVYRE
jgi:ribosomal protein S18 acetylase RimI-like enzyme